MDNFETQLVLAAVADVLRSKRIERGLSQEELSEQAALDRTYISGIERSTRNVSIGSLMKIVICLFDVPEDFFSELAKKLRKQKK